MPRPLSSRCFLPHPWLLHFYSICSYAYINLLLPLPIRRHLLPHTIERYNAGFLFLNILRPIEPQAEMFSNCLINSIVMESKTISIVALILLMFVGLFVWGYAGKGGTTASVQNAAATGAESALIASETLHDFGIISMKNGNVAKEFTITNPNDTDIT